MAGAAGCGYGRAMPSPVWQVELPSFRSGVASLLTVCGTGRLRRWAWHFRSGRPLVADPTEYVRGLTREVASLPRGRG